MSDNVPCQRADALDRRSQRTRAAILAAFSDLILAHGYAKVTVAAVTKAADVGRSTFYEHFDGKDDLLVHSLTGPFSALAATVDADRAPSEFVAMLTHFREQREFGRVLFLGATRQLVTRRLAALIEQRMGQAEPAMGAGVRRPLLAFQLAGSHLALIEAWIWGGLAHGADTIAAALVFSAQAALAQAHGMEPTYAGATTQTCAFLPSKCQL